MTEANVNWKLLKWLNFKEDLKPWMKITNNSMQLLNRLILYLNKLRVKEELWLRLIKDIKKLESDLTSASVNKIPPTTSSTNVKTNFLWQKTIYKNFKETYKQWKLEIHNCKLLLMKTEYWLKEFRFFSKISILPTKDVLN